MLSLDHLTDEEMEELDQFLLDAEGHANYFGIGTDPDGRNYGVFTHDMKTL